jgi:hypothetical protein
MMSLGSLLTNEDLAAFLANLPQQRDEPLLVDIYELYQEILARYQTRLHSDDRVWHAEIDANNAQGALAQHIQEQGETLDCSGRVQTTDAAVCQRREILERDAEESMERYIEALQTVNNEMIDNGLMPLMDEQMSNQSQAREMFAATTVAVVGVFVPLTLQDAAIDALTAGLGRIRRVGDALAEIVRTVRGTGRAALDRVRDVTDDAVDRIQDFRMGRNGANEFQLSQAQIDEIRAIPHGQWPNPRDYLPASYIANHLSQFDSGATRFMTRRNLDRYGIGQRDGTAFVMPSREADQLIASANGDPRVIEDALGLPENFLDGNQLVRIDITAVPLRSE